MNLKKLGSVGGSPLDPPLVLLEKGVHAKKEVCCIKICDISHNVQHATSALKTLGMIAFTSISLNVK